MQACEKSRWVVVQCENSAAAAAGEAGDEDSLQRLAKQDGKPSWTHIIKGKQEDFFMFIVNQCN